MRTPIQPKYISFADFAARFHEDYIEAHLPIIQDEKEWVTWANAVCVNPSFSAFTIPGPGDDESSKQPDAWRTWAEKLYLCITNNIQN